MDYKNAIDVPESDIVLDTEYMSTYDYTQDPTKAQYYYWLGVLTDQHKYKTVDVADVLGTYNWPVLTHHIRMARDMVIENRLPGLKEVDGQYRTQTIKRKDAEARLKDAHRAYVAARGNLQRDARRAKKAQLRAEARQALKDALVHALNHGWTVPELMTQGAQMRAAGTVVVDTLPQAMYYRMRKEALHEGLLNPETEED